MYLTIRCGFGRRSRTFRIGRTQLYGTEFRDDNSCIRGLKLGTDPHLHCSTTKHQTVGTWGTARPVTTGLQTTGTYSTSAFDIGARSAIKSLRQALVDLGLVV